MRELRHCAETGKDYYEDLRIILRRCAWQLLDHANYSHIHTEGGETVSPILNLADIVQITDLYCDNPRLYKKIIVPVDPLIDNPEEIIQKMTLSYARSAMEAREVGTGEADKKAVEQSWRFHHQLYKTHFWKEIWRNLLYALYILAGFATTLVVVVAPFFPLRDSRKEDETTSKFDVYDQWIAVVLTVTVCSGVLGLISADSQLNKIRIAQAKIAFEILRFRMQIGKYSIDARERANNDKAGVDSVKMLKAVKNGKVDGTSREDNRRSRSNNVSTAMHVSRQRFSQTIEAIMQDLSSLDLYYDKLVQVHVETVETVKDFNKFKEYMKSRLYLRNPKDKKNDAVSWPSDNSAINESKPVTKSHRLISLPI